MQKAKEYDWKDSNMALFGSDTDRQVKKESAQTEPAWKGAGEKEGVEIWRIEKFKVVPWPKDEYGNFFNGDSYIILNTYKNPGEEDLQYDVHFWIGAESSQDEYGTAAYKTVELDTLLDDKPVQHREVQDNESELFKSYFSSIVLLKGGCASGFKHVSPTEYRNRLFHFKLDNKRVKVKEVPCRRQSLNSDDVFILDLGLKGFLWMGKTANKNEKFSAVQYLQKLKSDRNGKMQVDTISEEEISETHIFYERLGNDPDCEPRTKGDFEAHKKVLKLSDDSGKLTFETVLDGSIDRSVLRNDDVFIIDNGKHLFVYIGSESSETEKKNGLTYAHKYLMDTDHPFIPVTCISANQKSAAFDAAFD